MILEKNIKLKNMEYVIGIELKYRDDGFLSKMDGSYFDNGDFGYLIKELEKRYRTNEYYKIVTFINDVTFIYDCIPFISYVKNVFYDQEGHLSSGLKITKDEILELIKKYNISLGLFDGKNSISPLLYK